MREESPPTKTRGGRIEVGGHWVPARFVRTYIDGKPKGMKDPNESPEVVITPALKAEVSPTSYEHMIGRKLANIKAIVSCIKAGINTQPAIKKATGICQGTISIRLGAMEKDGEIRVNRTSTPWIYSILEKA